MTTLPPKFVERLGRELDAASCEALCRALEGDRAVGVRINGAKCASVAELAALKVAAAVPWCAAGYLLAGRPSFTADTDFHAGAYYVQEPASQFVGLLAEGAGVRGGRVLDLCAAPGGKTTLYASLVGPEGMVVANEIDRRRAAVLADNVRKWGTGNVAVTCCDAQRIAVLEGWFDLVAVDAPCSGEGMFRKDEEARAEWSEQNVRLCAARQDEILQAAWRTLRPGGTLIYSTCTFNRDENEGTLRRFGAWAGDELAEAPDPAVDPAWGIVRGTEGAFRTFRFYPHRTCGEGFFAAVARKADGAEARGRQPRGGRRMIVAADRATAGELGRWVSEPDRMRFGVVADTCYGWYAGRADEVRMLSETLPVIYSGVALGQLFKGRLKPDPALALFAGLERGALPAVELPEDEALDYLRKRDLQAGRFAEGLNLVTARGRALGFAKRIGARVNNMYPNSLRIMNR